MFQSVPRFLQIIDNRRK